MSAKYFAILTNQGAALLANATALGTQLNLTQLSVGDANGALPTPDPTQTKLINQRRIKPLNQLSVDPANPGQIIAEQIIPENEGGFWIREIGLFDDNGVLIAVANCPETYKPLLQEGSGRTQTIRMVLIVSSTAAVTLKIDPSVVLATRQYVDDKVIEVKVYADDLMKKHLAEANPHPKYAPIASPTFTGTPKAPTPPLVANDGRIATAEFVQALAALKQPLNQTLTDLSGKDVAGILQYLGLGDLPDFGSAAGRDVGTGTGQIPDMSSFASQLGNPAVFEFPNELIIQMGTTNITSGNQNITLPKAFPNAHMGGYGVMNPDVSAANIEHVQGWPSSNSTLRLQSAFISGSTIGPITSGLVCWICWGY